MRSIEYSNDQLIRMIKEGGAGRNSALTQLIADENRTGKLFHYLSQRGATREDAEDVFYSALQDLIVAVQSGRFKPDGDIRAYLFGTCKNKWLNRYKKESRAMAGDHITTFYNSKEDIPADEILVRRETADAAWKRFQELSELCRQILMLAFFEKKSNDEIALIVDYKDERVVRVKKSKCLKALWELGEDSET